MSTLTGSTITAPASFSASSAAMNTFTTSASVVSRS